MLIEDLLPIDHDMLSLPVIHANHDRRKLSW